MALMCFMMTALFSCEEDHGSSNPIIFRNYSSLQNQSQSNQRSDNAGEMGTLVLWATDLLGESIDIYLDGEHQGKITEEGTLPQLCGSSGNVILHVNPDVHKVSAKNRTYFWEGVFNVGGGECKKVEISKLILQ